MITNNSLHANAKFMSAIQYQEVGNLEAAENLYYELVAQYPDVYELLQRIGYVLAQRGKSDDAIRYLERAVQLQPENALAYYSLGMAQDLGGNQDAAMESMRCALTYQPDFYHAQNAIAEMMLPFENYMDVLKRFHLQFRPSNYVEIGVESGASMALAEPPTVCVGIDPNPQIRVDFLAITRIFNETSDDFFSNHDLREELRNEVVEMAFIDGLHHFEAVLRDFINIERYSSKDTIVLIHDCIPLDETTSSRERSTTFWSGDTWKIVPCLKQYRPDLKVTTIPAPPTGLTVVTGLDSESSVLHEKLNTILDQYIPLDFGHLGQEKDEILNVIYDDWETIIDRIR